MLSLSPLLNPHPSTFHSFSGKKSNKNIYFYIIKWVLINHSGYHSFPPTSFFYNAAPLDLSFSDPYANQSVRYLPQHS